MPTRQGGLDVRRLSIARDTSGKYANAASPQWMRTLEDKYQKLHKKILLSARLNNIRTHRSRLQILKNGGIFRQSNITSARTKISSNTVNIADSEETDKDNVNENVKINSGDTSAVESDLAVTEEIEATGDAKMEADSSSFKKETTFLSEGHKTQGGTYPISMHRLNKSSTDPKVLSLHPPNGLSVNVNMPNGRESHYTARSCPAMIQTLKQMGAPRLSQTGSCRRGLRGFRSLNMFSKMSTEAQHAVSETLMEMGAEKSTSMTTESSSALDLRDMLPISGPVKERHYTNVNSRFFHTYAQCKRGLGIGRRERHQVVSNTSTCSSDSTELSHHVRLPQLTANGTAHIENIERARLRVPGVGKYDIAMFRESTFQITAPDFDIRYRDVLSCEHHSPDTPPLEEIKTRAIEKCQAWLTKYTAR